MAFVRKKKRRHRLTGRTSSGRFTKKAHRRAASAPSRRRRRGRRSLVVHRNPSLIVANPFRGVKRKRRRRRIAAHSVGRRTHRRVHRNPFRSRRRSTGRHWHMAGIGYMAKVGLAGAAGVVFARAMGYMYQKYLATYVLGPDAAGGNTARAILNDVGRIVFMSASTVLVEEGLRRSRVVSPDLVKAFLIGGLAEAGREGIGIALGRAGITDERKKQFGLDGPQVRACLTDDGRVLILAADGNWYPREQMQGVVDADEFAGVRAAASY